MSTMTYVCRRPRTSLLALACLAVAALFATPAEAGTCSQVVGPFQTQHQANRVLQQAQARGYATGPVYGRGGLYSNYSNRRWFFTVYYGC